MHHPVNYDFPVADELVHVLKMAHDKVHNLVRQRHDMCWDLLGDPKSGDGWRGGKRQDFNGHFTPQQKALQDLAADLLTMLGDVNDTTDKARALGAGAP